MTAAMDAFVDRAPIDWTALKSRLRAGDDRPLVDALQAIDRVRGAARALRARDAPPRRPALRLLIAIAGLQTISRLILAAPYALPPAGGRTMMQLLLAIAFGAGALLLAGASTRDGRRLFLIGFLVCCSGAFARATLLALPSGPPPWSRFLWVEMFAPAFLWQFALDFPHVERFTRFDLIARRITVAVWTLGGIAAAASLAVAAGLVPEDAVRALLPNDRSNLYWRAYTIASLLAVAAIVVRAHRAPAAEQRTVLRLAAALAAGTGPLLVLGIVRTALPAVDRWLSTGPMARPWAISAVERTLGAAPAARSWIDAVVVAALLATPILIGAAVVVDRPFDRQQRLAHAARRLARRAAMWSAARHRRQLTAALDSLRRVRGSREICRIVADAIATGLNVPIVRVLERRPDAFADCLGAPTTMPVNAAFVAMVRASPSALRLDAGSALCCVLPAREQRWLETESIQLAVAITSRERTLAAIVAIGGLEGSHAFNRRDLWFVETIAAAASAAWTDEPLSIDAAPDAAEPQAAFECPECGIVSEDAALPCRCRAAPALAALPARLGAAYRVQRRLGSGGMGIVYVGRDLRLHREVALKTLPGVAMGAVARLQDEARAMASLNHDGLATIYGLEIWRGVPVLVCEYFANGTLAQRLAAHGALEPVEVVRLGIALARALESMHASGRLHGDIKPANVGFTSSGTPKLLDFGLSRLFLADDDSPGSRVVAGTLGYLSPEALRGHAPSAAFDLWSLSVVLLECVVGTQPFLHGTDAATRRAILNSEASALAAPARGRDPRLGSWLERALGPLSGRFESASAMRQSLERLAPDAPAADHRE